MAITQPTTTGADLRALAVADMTTAALIAAGAIATAAERAAAAGRDYLTAGDVADYVRDAMEPMGAGMSALDAAHAAGDELRAMSAPVLARHFAAGLAAGLPADRLARLNYYLQISLGGDSMRELAAGLAAELPHY